MRHTGLATLLLAAVATSTATDPPVVQIREGTLRGSQQGNVNKFLGVPYARPPVADLRFMPPQPLNRLAWPGVRNATEVSPGCVREGAGWYTLNPLTSEDCLTLDLWSPADPVPGAKFPVMVWIFGGGFNTGSGDSLQTRGNRLVEQFGDVVVVAINYRLGVLGWAGSSELRRESFLRFGVNSTGNMGLMDMQAALSWVQTNVAAFNGDPSRVMIFGESAGAGAVSALMASRNSRGLFHKAAMQSGGFQKWTAMPLKHAQGNYVALIKQLHKHGNKPGKAHGWHRRCHPGEPDLVCLRRIPAKQLMEQAANHATQFENSSLWDGYDQCQWGPIVDGAVLLEHPFKAIQHGRLAHPVPTLIGMNKDDGTEFMDGCPDDVNYDGNPSCPLSYRTYTRMTNIFAKFWRADSDGPFGLTDRLYNEWLDVNYGASNRERLLQVYPGPRLPGAPSGGRAKTNYWAGEMLMGDYIMYCTGRRAARKIAAQLHLHRSMHGANVYQYYFRHTPNQAPFRQKTHPRKQYVTDGFGACHGCEIPFVFMRDDSQEYGISGTGELALGKAMSTYWTNFAWSSNVNNATGRNKPAIEATKLIPKWEGNPASDDRAVLFDASKEEALITMAEKHPRADFCDAFWDKYFSDIGWFE